LLVAGLLLGALANQFATGAPLVLNTQRLHLGSPDAPEWEWFAAWPPDARRLDLRFTAQPNVREATLFIRQDDVRQDWSVGLNGKRLGKLFLMEADLVHTIAIAPGTMRDGENVLSLLPPKENDDIVIQQVEIVERPLNEAIAEGTLEVTVTNAGDRTPLPCRLTVVDARGALAPLIGLTNAPARPLAVRPGVVYTGDGHARIGLRAGDYTVYASHGFEWGVATQQVHVASGQVVRLASGLYHEVATQGLVSCDTHVHTFTHSGHGDATIEERMLTLAGEGIELPIATDHNLHIDYSATARRLGVTNYFTPVTGNEVTTAAGHFNIFPVQPDARVPDFKITDWPRLMSAMRATPDVRVIVLNHPRNVHNDFQPFAATNFNAVTGENKRGPEFTFDAMEVLNSSAQQSDYMLVYRDWFALLNHGYRITAVGSSDGHDVSRYIVGQGRTYIGYSKPGQLDVAVACSNLLAGRTFVSMGLLVQMSVGGMPVGQVMTRLREQVRVGIGVLGPSWVSATNVSLFANGVKIREWELAPSQSVGEKGSVTWLLPRPAHDVYLVAIATGPAVTAPYWAIPRPYQPTSRQWAGRVIGSTHPIFLDADGDGRFTPARDYARKLIEEHGLTSARLLPALKDYDEAVAAQAASLCAARGARIDGEEFSAALGSAAPQVQRGFAAFAATMR
jgi:hypothetical protein